MNINQGYIVLTLEEYAERIANHEKVAMKIAIKAIMTDFSLGINKLLMDIFNHHIEGVDNCNVNRENILLQELIENNYQEKPENLHS